MSKSSLRMLAVLLTVGIIVVLFAGLDGLPREVKAQIAAERKSLTAAQSQLQSAQAEVSRDLASESALFGALPSAREYPARLGGAATSLAAAGQSLAELEKLEKQNRRATGRAPNRCWRARSRPAPRRWRMPKACAKTRRTGST